MNESKLKAKKEKHLLKQMRLEGINEKCKDWEEVNMTEELHPISYYINDKEELVKQMFTVISNKNLRNMLPPVLKKYKTEDLEADCLIQLVGMSTKRIKSIMEGKELESSSDSSVNENITEETEAVSVKRKKKKKSKKSDKFTNLVRKFVREPEVLDIGIPPKELENIFDDGNCSKKKKLKTKHKLKKPVEVDKPKAHRNKQTVEVYKPKTHTNKQTVEVDTNKQAEEEIVQKKEDQSDADKILAQEGTGKTLLEILELEMRARAIRALLQRENQPSKDSDDKVDLISSIIGDEDEKGTEKTNLEEGKQPNKHKTEQKEEISTIDLTGECEIPETIELDASKEELGTEIIDSATNVEACTSTVNLNKDNENLTQNNDQPESTGKPPHGEKRSWAERWLESSQVRKVVSTSKMCTNIRKRMKKSMLSKIVKDVQEDSNKSNEGTQEFSGSTSEYEQLQKQADKDKHDTEIEKKIIDNEPKLNSDDTLLDSLDPSNSSDNLNQNENSRDQADSNSPVLVCDTSETIDKISQ